MVNKILIGKGNLQRFSEDYEKTTIVNKGRMWSQLYPINIDICNNEHEFRQAYEWVIGYEVNEEVQQQQKMVM